MGVSPRRAVIDPRFFPSASPTPVMLDPRFLPAAAPAAAPVAAPVAAPAADDGRGFWANLLPSTRGAVSSAAADFNQSLGRGTVGEAVGNSLRQLITVPAGLATDLVGRPLKVLGEGALHVGAGLIGSTGDTAVNVRAPAAAAKAAAAPKAVAKPAAPAALADEPITAQDRLQAALSVVLRNPNRNDLKLAAGVLPSVATTKLPTVRDVQTQTAAQIALSQFQESLAAAIENAKGDPVEERKQRLAALATYQRQSAALAGVNVQGLAQAGLLADVADQ